MTSTTRFNKILKSLEQISINKNDTNYTTEDLIAGYIAVTKHYRKEVIEAGKTREDFRQGIKEINEALNGA